MSDLQFIDLNERAYKYIRQFTIKSVEDALVELITNCIDAYNKGNILPRIVDIEYIDPNIVKVRDYAIGLTGTDMQKCFLQVGNYTNTEDSRGFFSRGAKDISAIGDITFETIKDNNYSRIFLNSDAYGRTEVLDQDISTDNDNIRGKLGIPNNGLLVTLKLLPNFVLISPSDQAQSLSKLAVLRDIMNDTNNNITFTEINENGTILFSRQLIYNYPVGTLLLEVEYNVPNYNGKLAKFSVYKTTDPIPQPKKENEMEFGFLIKDNTTIYQVNTIDDRFRWNPYMPYIYGSLYCEYIHELLIDYDTNGSSTMNPMPVIDPSRLSGVNEQHPFIVSMLSIPKVRLDQILRELNTKLSEQSISLSEVNDLFDELAKYGLDIIDDEDIKLSFTPSYDSKLAKAIEDDRMNFVTTEKNYLLTKNYNTILTPTDKYIKEQLMSQPTNPSSVYIGGPNGELIEVPLHTPDLNISNPIENVNMLQIIPDDQISNLQTRPYVYQLTNNRDLVKLYLFQRGKLEHITNPEDEYVTIKSKKFNISFINDINLNQRYIIEYDNGVSIKINIASESVKKYLVKDTWTGHHDLQLSVSNMTSSRSLVFLKELMIEILSAIILENDIINNKLILDSNNFNNTKKVLTYKNNIICRLEPPLESIFEKYLTNNRNKKSTELNTIMDNISTLVSEKIDMATEGGNIRLLKSQLDNLLNNLLE